MNIIEAITHPKVLAGTMWAGRQGWGSFGVSWFQGRLCEFPALCPGKHAWEPLVKDFAASDWQVFNPTSVGVSEACSGDK